MIVSSWVERTAIEMADAVVAVSQGTKEDVLRLFNVPEDRIHIIYNGIDPDEYRPVKPPTSLQNTGSTRECRSCSSSVASRGKRALSILVRRDRIFGAGLPGGALRGRARHARDRGRNEGRRGTRAGQAAGRDLDRRDGLQNVVISCIRMREFSAARRFTSHSASSISRRWPVRRPWWAARSAALRR